MFSYFLSLYLILVSLSPLSISCFLSRLSPFPLHFLCFEFLLFLFSFFSFPLTFFSSFSPSFLFCTKTDIQNLISWYSVPLCHIESTHWPNCNVCISAIYGPQGAEPQHIYINYSQHRQKRLRKERFMRIAIRTETFRSSCFYFLPKIKLRRQKLSKI